MHLPHYEPSNGRAKDRAPYYEHSIENERAQWWWQFIIAALVVRSRQAAGHGGLLPLRRQKLPDEVHPHGQVAFGGFGMASCAPWDGTQNEPLVV
jgi:hypothetical protein